MFGKSSEISWPWNEEMQRKLFDCLRNEEQGRPHWWRQIPFLFPFPSLRGVNTWTESQMQVFTRVHNDIQGFWKRTTLAYGISMSRIWDVCTFECQSFEGEEFPMLLNAVIVIKQRALIFHYLVNVLKMCCFLTKSHVSHTRDAKCEMPLRISWPHQLAMVEAQMRPCFLSWFLFGPSETQRILLSSGKGEFPLSGFCKSEMEMHRLLRKITRIYISFLSWSSWELLTGLPENNLEEENWDRKWKTPLQFIARHTVREFSRQMQKILFDTNLWRDRWQVVVPLSSFCINDFLHPHLKRNQHGGRMTTGTRSAKWSRAIPPQTAWSARQGRVSLDAGLFQVSHLSSSNQIVGLELARNGPFQPCDWDYIIM